MGMDGIEIAMCIEDTFSLPHSESNRLFWTDAEAAAGWSKGVTTTTTAGEFHKRVCEALRKHGRDVPPDSWPKVQQCIGKTLGIDPATIRAEQRIVQDLGAS